MPKALNTVVTLRPSTSMISMMPARRISRGANRCRKASVAAVMGWLCLLMMAFLHLGDSVAAQDISYDSDYDYASDYDYEENSENGGTECFGNSQHEAEEKTALLDLSSLPPSMGWSNETIPCAEGWKGVTCDDQCHVIQIELPYEGLSGSLPAIWSILESLQLLDLSSNDITGSLPSVWSTMENMQFMILNDNNITGSLPREWSSMAILVEMVLYTNEITGLLTREWSTMAVLEIMDLATNKITGSIPQEWSAMENMYEMYLFGNNLTGSLPREWSTMTNMMWILCNGNGITGSLPPEWSTASKMHSVYLDDNDISGSLPPEWSTMANVKEFSMSHLLSNDLNSKKITGSLPAAWSTMENMFLMYLDGNDITGTLPREWSKMKNMEVFTLANQHSSRLNKNKITGSLPREWSTMRNMIYLDMDRIVNITGSLPREWSTMESIEEMLMSGSKITGSLPPEWSTMTMQRQIKLASNKLTGLLPETWSTMAVLQRMLLKANDFTGTLPAAWTAMKNLELMVLDSNRISGTIPKEWIEVFLTAQDHYDRDFCQAKDRTLTISAGRRLDNCPTFNPESDICHPFCNAPECWSHPEQYPEGYNPGPAPQMDLHGCFGAYKATSTYAARLDMTNNLLTGRANGAPELGNLGDGLNCMSRSGTGTQQRFCPPAALPWYLVAALIVTLCIVLASIAWLKRGRQRQRSAVTGFKSHWNSFMSHFKPSELCRSVNILWLIATVLSLGWSLFVLSPAFERIVVVGLASGSSTPLASVLVRNLAATLQPLAWGTILLWHGLVTIYSASGLSSRNFSREASSWTIVASQDSLRENLAVIYQDQGILGAVFLVLVPLVAALNAVALPASFSQWVTVATPPPKDTVIEFQEAPVWMELQVQVPVALVALGTASLLVVLYHLVSCITLPSGLLASRAVRDVSNPSVWEAAASSKQKRMLKSLFWLRQAGWVRLISIVIAASGFTAAALLIETPETSGYDYYEDWQPYKDKEADGNYEPLNLGLGQAHVIVAAVTLAVQLLLAAAWNILAMSWLSDAASCEDEETAAKTETAPDGPSALDWHNSVGRRLWVRLVSSRSHAQRSIFLIVIGLQMIPVLGAGYLPGWLLVCVIWFMSCVLFAAALLVQDAPAGFEALRGSPGFGMVLLASDLAEALAANLAEEDQHQQASLAANLAEDQQQKTSHEPLVDDVNRIAKPSRCCSDGAHPAGCKACQQILRRFPATLTRMQETLAVSYRWQPVMQALVHPEGCAGHAPFAGMKDGIVGLNMTRWQRQQLLTAIQGSPYPYVWLDALSIPAAVLGHQSSHGASAWWKDLSNTLLTRMMAVYAAAANTLVLRSSEPAGVRYHQRAWTMQEFCGASAVTICSEDGVDPVPYTMEEDVEFSELRSNIRSAMRSALPVWGQRLQLDTATNGATRNDVEGRKETQIRGVEAFAKAQAKVGCQVPVDKVRALLPIFLNSPVQDAAELRDLVDLGVRLATEGGLSAEIRAAMQKARALVDAE